MGHGHHHGRRNPFAGNIPDTEEEFSVPGIEVKNVTSYLAGRLQGTVDIGRELLGKHFLLNLAGYGQFSPYAGLLLGCLAEVFLVPGVAVDHKGQDGQAQKDQRHLLAALAAHPGKDFVGFIHLHYVPVGVFVHGPAAVRKARYGRCRNDAVDKIHHMQDLMLRRAVLRGTGHQPSLTGQQQAEGRRIRLLAVEGISQPGKVYVQAADGHYLASVVIDGI